MLLRAHKPAADGCICKNKKKMPTEEASFIPLHAIIQLTKLT